VSAAIAGNKTLTAAFQAGAASWFASLSVPEAGSGTGASDVAIPSVAAEVELPLAAGADLAVFVGEQDTATVGGATGVRFIHGPSATEVS
jgi:hypothetical protein